MWFVVTGHFSILWEYLVFVAVGLFFSGSSCGIFLRRCIWSLVFVCSPAKQEWRLRGADSGWGSETSEEVRLPEAVPHAQDHRWTVQRKITSPSSLYCHTATAAVDTTTLCCQKICRKSSHFDVSYPFHIRSFRTFWHSFARLCDYEKSTVMDQFAANFWLFFIDHVVVFRVWFQY